ncbi:hypothetical protein [uncultured Holdemanella sp.]|uniref:hypothetical protein n=1 Tax=uncultured Holdemanella sp. TaxID=1763549 RepID=UPI0025F6E82D|nr:hypothetical protein [uncultured Holdemanella sp.]
MLYRKIERTIEQHLKSGSNKILLVDGARQIGKTYIIRYVVSNERTISQKGKIIYLPIYYLMFF